MKSILDLLSTIMSLPSIDARTHARARFLHARLGGAGASFASLFGGAR